MTVKGAVYSGVLQQTSENKHKARDYVNIKRSCVRHIWSRTPSVKEVAHGKNSYDAKRDTSRGGVGINPERDPTEKDDQGNRKIKAIHVEHQASFEDERGFWLRENACKV